MDFRLQAIGVGMGLGDSPCLEPYAHFFPLSGQLPSLHPCARRRDGRGSRGSLPPTLTQRLPHLRQPRRNGPTHVATRKRRRLACSSARHSPPPP